MSPMETRGDLAASAASAPASRPATAAQGPLLGSLAARHRRAGHRHRREHGDVRRAGRRRATAPSVRAGRAPRHRLEDQPHRPDAPHRALLSGVPGVAGAIDQLRESRRPADYRLRIQLRPDRPRRSGRHRERARHRRVLRRARRTAIARPLLQGDGRPGGSAADRRPHPRVLDEPSRRGPRSVRQRAWCESSRARFYDSDERASDSRRRRWRLFDVDPEGK